MQDGLDIAYSLVAVGMLRIVHRGQYDEGCEMLRQAVARYHQMGLPHEAFARQTAQRLGCATADPEP